MKSFSSLHYLVLSVVLAGSILGVQSLRHSSIEGSTIAYVDPSYFLGSQSSSVKSTTACGEGIKVGDTRTLQSVCQVCVCTNNGMQCSSMQNCGTTRSSSSSSSRASVFIPSSQSTSASSFTTTQFQFSSVPIPVLPTEESSSSEIFEEDFSSEPEDDLEPMFPDDLIPDFPTPLPEEYEQSSSSVTVVRFLDLSPLTPEGNAAYSLAALGIINGFPDGRFKPDLPVNRAEAAKMILLARFGLEAIPPVQTGNPFVDVPNEEWYAPYILFANSKGIISGYPDRTFKAGYLVNTAEFLKMITIAFNLPTNNLHAYQDVPVNSWFYRYAGTASVYNLFPDRPFLQLQPERFLTRGEVAVALYKLLQNR